MLGLLQRCFPEQIAGWEPKLTELIPTYGTTLNDKPERAREVLARTADVLHITG